MSNNNANSSANDNTNNTSIGGAPVAAPKRQIVRETKSTPKEPVKNPWTLLGILSNDVGRVWFWYNYDRLMVFTWLSCHRYIGDNASRFKGCKISANDLESVHFEC
eukprot:TRINITY_DN4392_c0_g1_i2.p2 TRINITY_DN4392_c0_g1~~TRINITY_DN4392_c0_g1_i2.p2  ORF type:complete len:106 (-),score=3.69 TRINITY_DN4392_c0_g1_i2:503-820(-)